MKIFSFIFIIYILLLSFVPCEDFTATAELRVDETSPIIRIQDDPQTDKTGDDCSPFCICSCCQTFTVSNFPAFTVKSSYTILTVHDTKISYQNNYSQQHLTNIWQPPKFNS